MDCPNCGFNNPPGTLFCEGCGQQVPQTAQAEEPVAAAAAAGEAGAPPAQAAAPAPTGTGYNPNAEYDQGCFAAAWSDLRASEGWIGRTLLLGLIMIVPILNFVVIGYAIIWGRDAARGERYQLPDHIFADGSFKIGFFAVVLGLVVSLVLNAVTFVLLLVPILGQLAAIALEIAAIMLVSMAMVRIGLTERLGSGFGFAQMWEAAKREPGKLFCATFLPSLVIGLVGCAIAGVFATIGLVSIVGGSAAMYTGYSAAAAASYSAATAMTAGGAGAVLGGVMLFFTAVVIAITTALANLVSTRACGIWASRYAPEWADEE